MQEYFAWRDLCRHVAGVLPDANSVVELNWVAHFTPPESLSKLKRERLIGMVHRSKPDRDNIDKAVLDALFKEDSAIAAGTIKKLWGQADRIEIEIIYEVDV